MTAARTRRIQRFDTRITWLQENIERIARMNMRQRLQLAGQLLRDRVVINISRPVTKTRRVGGRGGGSRIVVTNRSRPGEFPPSTHRYTPTVPGYYKAIGGAQGQDLIWVFCRPQRNYGQSSSYGSGTSGSAGNMQLRAHANNPDSPAWGTGIFAMNGTNDYLSLIGISYSGSSKNFDGGFLIVEYMRAL